MSSRIFTKTQLVNFLVGEKISERKIKYWTDLEIIKPIVPQPRGKGHHRLYTIDNAVEVAVAARLQRFGFSLEKIAYVLSEFRKNKPSEISLKDAASDISVSIKIDFGNLKKKLKRRR